MSWDAYLSCQSCGSMVGDWNYTHNINGMIAAAYEAISGEQTEQCGGPLGPVIGPAWWDRLEGKTGVEGSDYLAQIIKGLEADPERFRAMNPDNGWGAYETLVPVLREMEERGRAAPDLRWHVSG